MKTITRIAGTLLVLLGLSASAHATIITYDLISLGANQYQYDYTVYNNSLGTDLKDFSIYFPDESSPTAFDYAAIGIAGTPGGWTGSSIQASAINLGGWVEWFSATGIAPGGSLGGFSASFMYTGTAPLGSQRFLIWDDSFNALNADPPEFTQPIPEASTVIAGSLCCLLLAGTSFRRFLHKR